MKFILVSRLEKIKNLDIVIEVFNKINSKDELWIVGDGRYKEELIRKAKNKSIKFFGYVDEGTLKKLYQKADACIMPHIYEPLGLVPLEIAKYGKPSIVSELSGIAYYVKKFNCGLLFNPKDEKNLREKIEILKNPKIYRKLKRNVSKMYKSLNPDKIFKSFIQKNLSRKTKSILVVFSQFIEIGGAEKSILGLINRLKRTYSCDYSVTFDKSMKKWEILYRSKIRKLLCFLYIPRIIKKYITVLKNYDVIILNVTGMILSIPVLWSFLFLSSLLSSKTIIYIHEPPISFHSVSRIEKILLSPILILDVLLFRLFSKKVIIVSNSEFSRKITMKRYKIYIPQDNVFPSIYHLGGE